MQLLRGKRFVKHRSWLSTVLRPRRGRFFLQSLLVCVGVVVASFVFSPSNPLKNAFAAACPLGATFNVVAHEDDDILFLSPDLLHAVQAGRCVRTVFVTAGDAGAGPGYWQDREAGSKAAYIQMTG